MRKLVVLKFNGDFDRGFQVSLEIGLELGQNGRRPAADIQGSLPANPAMPQAYERWRIQYRRLFGGIQTNPNTGQVCTFAELTENCNQAADELKDRFSTWLQAAPFQPIQNKYFEHFNPTDEIRILVRTDCQTLQKLPWHQWDWIEGYDNTEIAIGAPESEAKTSATVAAAQNKVRILAILGNSTGINVEPDRQLLEQLPDTEIVFLEQPDRKAINNQLWAQPWDVLFFTGHSETRETTGHLYINRHESLTVADLRYGLKQALKQGLQLAIFNSCDGLGLAWALEDLRIPQIIVMREPVPDKVAQEFLKAFLQAFSGGLSLYQAVGKARRQLQSWEDFYPCASWLPMIVQNATAVPPTWHTLRYGDRKAINKRILWTALIASIAVAAAVIGVRSQGWMQAVELKAYDWLVRLRPDEGPDPRLLIVAVTEEDIQAQKPEQRQGSLSDATLHELLKRLEPHQPRVIALDIYRDFSVGAEITALAARLKQTDRFIGICKVGETDIDPGIPPPPEIPPNRLGFSDVPVDADGVVRRQLLGMSSSRNCETNFSFSLQVVLRYLADRNIQASRRSGKDFQIGTLVLRKLKPHTGGYRLPQEESQGYQVLLNYRSSKNIARQVKLTDMLADRFEPKWVHDRIVLIGTTAQSSSDYFPTPYTSQQYGKEVPGVMIQAQMVSQLLSAVLDNRPLLWVWPWWGENLWILSWSLVGGLLVWGLRWQSLFSGDSHRAVLGAVAIAVLLLSGSSFIFFSIQRCWVPLVPPTLTLIVTSSIVRVRVVRLTQPKKTA